jgi:hypothetical protein
LNQVAYKHDAHTKPTSERTSFTSKFMKKYAKIGSSYIFVFFVIGGLVLLFKLYDITIPETKQSQLEKEEMEK